MHHLRVVLDEFQEGLLRQLQQLAPFQGDHRGGSWGVVEQREFAEIIPSPSSERDLAAVFVHQEGLQGSRLDDEQSMRFIALADYDRTRQNGPNAAILAEGFELGLVQAGEDVHPVQICV